MRLHIPTLIKKFRKRPVYLAILGTVAASAVFSGLWQAGVFAPPKASAQFTGFSAHGEVIERLMPTGVDSGGGLLPQGIGDPHWGIERTYNDSGIGRPTCQATDGVRDAIVIEEVGGRAGLSYEGARPWGFTSPNAQWIGQNLYGRSEGHGLGNPHPDGGSWCYDPGFIGPVPPSVPGDPPTQKGPPGAYPMFDNPPHADWNTFVFKYKPQIEIDPGVDTSSLQLEIKGSVDDLVGVTVNGVPLDVECEGSPATTVTAGNIPMCAPGLEGNQFKASVMEGTTPFETDGSGNILRIYVKSAFSNTGMIITSAEIIGNHANAIDGRKVDEGFEMPGPWSDNEVTVSNRLFNDSSTENPFSFPDLDEETYTVSVENEPDHDVRWMYCRAPSDGTPNAPQPDGTCSPSGDTAVSGTGSSFSVSVSEGVINVYFIFSPKDEGIRSITGRKVDDAFNMPGPWSDNKVTIKKSGRTTSEQSSISNPFGFFNLELTTYNVSVEEEPNHSVRWAYCPLPGDGTPNSPKPDGTCQLGGQSTKGDGAVFTASLAANSIEVRFIFTQTTFTGEPPEHKVFGANVIEIAKKFLRDNERFEISFKTYIWPDAGIRGRGATPPNGDGRRNLWLAGIWGVDAPLPGDIGDNANDDNSWRANPNVWARLNWVAELDCTPGFFSECLQRVPAAYVPKDDGSGTPNTAEKDGSKTPEGNKWQPIRDHILNEGFEERLGGIASDLNMDVGGRRGNYINNIEISNIHIEADGIKSWKLDDAGFLQGRINGDLLQPDAQTLNLPGGSHGPQGNAWDNIREPSTGLLEVKTLIPDLGFSNENITSYNGLPNFVYNPQAIAPAEYGASSQLHADMSAVSLLQDGRGTGGADYTGHSEPLTYTATVERLGQARLHWDEYTEWTQVDNKGHWYTSRSRVPTGLAQGGEEFATATLQDFDQGSSEHVPQTCTGWNWNSETQSWESYTYDCSYWTSCSGSHSYATGWYYIYNSMSYFEDSVETRYGWLNNNPARTSQSSNWTTSPTHFFSSTNGREGNATPPWALTGNEHYWQDTAITDMSNDASSVKPPHDKYWIHDKTDPTYTGRHVYNQAVTPNFPVAWSYSYSTSCKYPNGGGAFDSGTETVGPYYPNPEHLYEDTGSVSGIYHGKYGAAATFDGNSDGIVDSGWAWSDNYQRVRYEQTYEDHHRKLGPRWRGGDPDDDDLLYGTDPTRHILAGRDFSNIYNPTIDVRNADVFAGGNLHSFFQTSQAQSAFLFSNRNIIQFSGSNQYPNYFINDNRGRVDAFYPNDEDPIAYIFRDINELEAAGAPPVTSVSDNLEKGGPEKGDNVWVVNGDLTLGGNNFSGVGTIIVRGNLFINGNIGYADTPTSNRRELSSLGVIVDGHILIAPGVTNIVGSYFSSGAVHTGSDLMDNVMPTATGITWTNNNNRTDSDDQLVVNGLMIARNFVLARNPSGEFNFTSQAESFRYDGRVVVNPPPGFARIFNADAIWNDTVPRN